MSRETDQPTAACTNPDPLDPDEACWPCDHPLAGAPRPPINEPAA